MMIIRKMKKCDAGEVAQLVSETFKKFNSNEATEGGLGFYLGLHSTKRTEDELWKKYGSKISLVALNGKKIIGMIAGSGEHMGNLFVSGSYHGKGIGSKLVNDFEKKARRLGIKKVRIRSSIYAVPFYSACGYKKSTGARRIHGIKIQPMAKNLK